MRIAGYASTPGLDRDGESIVQDGLDIGDFLEYGFLNYNHDNSYIVGYPDREKTRVDKNGFYLEGLLLDNDLGKRTWETALALEKSGAPRSFGFSVEGKTLKKGKDGRIEKAKIYNVAVTPTPVNPEATWEAVVKSMTSESIMNTTNASSLIPESLDKVKRWIKGVEDGEENAVKGLLHLKDSLNKSVDRESIKLYLMMFEGYEGMELEEVTDEIVEELNNL